MGQQSGIQKPKPVSEARKEFNRVLWTRWQGDGTPSQVKRIVVLEGDGLRNILRASAEHLNKPKASEDTLISNIVWRGMEIVVGALTASKLRRTEAAKPKSHKAMREDWLDSA